MRGSSSKWNCSCDWLKSGKECGWNMSSSLWGGAFLIRHRTAARETKLSEDCNKRNSWQSFECKLLKANVMIRILFTYSNVGATLHVSIIKLPRK